MIYHMFISGNNDSRSPYVNNPALDFAPEEEIVLLFDSIDNYNISLPNEKTSFPIESRSSISDHVFSSDGKFSFTGRITASPTYIRTRVEWDKNTDKSAPAETPRIQSAYEVVKAARDSRAVITLTTEEFDLTNYVITGFDFSREGPLNMGVFNITLEEMRVRTVGTTVLATNIGSGVQAGKSNQNKGSTQDANGNKPQGEVVDTKNRNARNTDFFLSKCAEGRQDYCQLVPTGTESEKFNLGINNNN